MTELERLTLHWAHMRIRGADAEHKALGRLDTPEPHRSAHIKVRTAERAVIAEARRVLRDLGKL